MALSTTAPGASASMVRLRSMQTADLAHMSLVSLYVPAASKILLIELSKIAAMNSPTVLADTIPGGQGGGEGGKGGEGGEGGKGGGDGGKPGKGGKAGG